MREIKFRVWDKRLKEIIGDLNGGCGYEDRCLMDVIGDESYELMQFTGLKDKNGKEIYEGDILEAPFFQTAAIEWIGSGFWCKQKNGTHVLPNIENTEVIGNIYENPELPETGGSTVQK